MFNGPTILLTLVQIKYAAKSFAQSCQSCDCSWQHGYIPWYKTGLQTRSWHPWSGDIGIWWNLNLNDPLSSLAEILSESICLSFCNSGKHKHLNGSIKRQFVVRLLLMFQCPCNGPFWWQAANDLSKEGNLQLFVCATVNFPYFASNISCLSMLQAHSMCKRSRLATILTAFPA